jgi:HSP20 family molecular chaperone IbpA
LPSDADAEKIDAQLADDILTARLPQRTGAQSRKIEIKS